MDIGLNIKGRIHAEGLFGGTESFVKDDDTMASHESHKGFFAFSVPGFAYLSEFFPCAWLDASALGCAGLQDRRGTMFDRAGQLERRVRV